MFLSRYRRLEVDWFQNPNCDPLKTKYESLDDGWHVFEQGFPDSRRYGKLVNFRDVEKREGGGGGFVLGPIVATDTDLGQPGFDFFAANAPFVRESEESSVSKLFSQEA